MKKINFNLEKYNSLMANEGKLDSLKSEIAKINNSNKKELFELLRSFEGFWLDFDKREEDDDFEMEYPFSFINKHGRSVNYAVLAVFFVKGELNVGVYTDEGDVFGTPYYNVELDVEGLKDLLSIFYNIYYNFNDHFTICNEPFIIKSFIDGVFIKETSNESIEAVNPYGVKGRVEINDDNISSPYFQNLLKLNEVTTKEVDNTYLDYDGVKEYGNDIPQLVGKVVDLDEVYYPANLNRTLELVEAGEEVFVNIYEKRNAFFRSIHVHLIKMKDQFVLVDIYGASNEVIKVTKDMRLIYDESGDCYRQEK